MSYLFVQKNKAYKTFRSKGYKHYDLQKQLFSSSVATGALCISSTDPPRTLEEEHRLNEEFLSRGKGKQKQHVDLEEGSDESDDPAHVAEPILTESRRRVPKRSQSRSSQMQECMNIFRESFTKNPQDTPPSVKRSKSISSPDKPKKNSIEEALDELAKLESRIPQPLFDNIILLMQGFQIYQDIWLHTRENGITGVIFLGIIRQQRKKSYSTSAMRQCVMSLNVASVF
ncbi:hypothetical protein CRG98_023337 [Punica granatum]|uniref:Uncharacterized protein n=1 Tax=Punica granatum TaxID=22663 RepID=A0A2I0JJ81_PUNGR|nr:hypothetical protein CRG98_023337 [Punica granatum]